MAKPAKQTGGDSGGNGGGGDGWAGFLTYLNKTFDLVRDVLGYALPGGVFLGLGVWSGRLSFDRVHQILCPYEPPPWAIVLLGIGACYAVGHILIAIAYFPYDLIKLAFYKCIANFPTEVTQEMLIARRRHPEFLSVLNRRETLTVTIAGLSAALFLGSLRFYGCLKQIPISTLLIWTAVILLVNFITGQLHLYRVRAAIGQADTASPELAPGEYERAVLGILKRLAKPNAEPGLGEKPATVKENEALATALVQALHDLKKAIKSIAEALSK
jgi:hypothetical protein